MTALVRRAGTLATIAALLLSACQSSELDGTTVPAPVPAPTGSAGSGLPPPPATANRNIETPYCTLAPTPEVGITETGRMNLSERTIEITVQSKAMKAAEKLLVTLPKKYDTSGATKYTVLYALHGSLDDHTSYFIHDLEGIVGDRPLIVVSPDAGPFNGYSDWYGTVAGSDQSAPAVETYVLDELLPFIESRFPVRADRAGRAVMGISMGGGGTMKFAAARPQLFGAAGSLSGAVNPTREYPYFPVVNTGTSAGSVVLGPLNHCIWGDFYTQHVIWKDNDPTYLAENLRGVPI